MTVTFKLICIILALLCFALAAASVAVHPRLQIGWLGAFFLTLALFVNA